jgi:quinolinate synthase
MDDLIGKIESLKKEKNAVILAHNYQIPAIQDITDYVGDSLGLSVQASRTDADTIVFCGVDFMAESAKILNETKKVILPDMDAKCPMAAMVDVEGLRGLREDNPQAVVVTYINTTAEVKSVSDICCTSSNAVKIVGGLPENNVIFIPDKNLGLYVQRFIHDKHMILWPGICPTHHRIKKEDLLALKDQHPRSEIMVHPECTPEVIDIADHVFSTQGMVNYAREADASSFIVGTERELCYRLKKENPGKMFYPLESAICQNMKKITLEKVEQSLEALEPEVTLSPDVIRRARVPLERMVDAGRGD